MSEATTAEPDDFLVQVGRSWGWVLFFGIVTLILGVLVTVHPDDTIYAFAILLGIWLFVSGLFRLVMAIADSEDSGGTRVLIAFLGLLSVLVGIFFLRHTFESVATLGFLIGLFWVIGGLIEFFSAYTHPGAPGRGWRVFMGLLGFIAGLITLVVPGLTLVILTTIIGIWLIVYGILQIVTSIRLRKLVQ